MVATREDPEQAPRTAVVSRRAAWVLIALCAWTLYVWITRLFIMAGQDESAGFKIVHGILAAISIAFGLAAGWIGYRALRPEREIRN